MPGFTRRRPSTSDTPGLLDEGPYLHLDQDLLGNQEALQRTGSGVLGFDTADPTMSRVGLPPLGGGLLGLGNQESLQRIAAGRGGPTGPMSQPGPGPAPADKGPSWINELGVGGVFGDWTFGLKPTRSTDDTFDTPGTRDRASRQAQDKMSEGWDPSTKE